MKIQKKLILISSLVIIFLLLLITEVSAASTNLTSTSTSVVQGTTVTVTGSVNAGAWNLTLSGANQSKGLVGQTSTMGNQSASTSITFTANTVGTYTFYLKGDITDYYTDITETVNKPITITVTAPAVVVPPTPPTPPTPTQPTIPSTPLLSSNANLSNLGINPYDFKGFKSSKTSYSVSVPHDAGSINIYANVQHSKATVSGTGNKSLSVGTNTFNINVKAEDGTTKTYTLYITRAAKAEEEQVPVKSSDALLSSLTITNALLSPAFDPTIKEYTTTVSQDFLEAVITATPNDNKAVVSIEGGTGLQLGENIATITVSAEDGTTEIYTIKIFKQNMKVALQTLIIGYIDENGKFFELSFLPEFNEDVFEYKLEDLKSSIDKLKVDALATNEDYIIEIKGHEVLKEGENIITILVRKEPVDISEETQETEYKITVNRQAKPILKNTDIIGNIKNWFVRLPGVMGDFVSSNKTIIMAVSLGFCAVAMLGLSIYIVIDYKKYKMILAKLSALVKANAGISNENNVQEDVLEEAKK